MELLFTKQKDWEKNSPCLCGKAHKSQTKHILITADGISKLQQLLEGLPYKKILVVSDVNTEAAVGKEVKQHLHKESFCSLVFSDSDLIPNEISIEKFMIEAQGKDLILAIGSGTINDLARFISFTKQIPYMIFCTAPSMDGYGSSVSPLLLNGLKTTVEAQVPLAIIGDLKVLQEAPYHMIIAGFGDLVGKYTCLMDWKMSHIFHGEYYCEEITGLTRESVNQAVKQIQSIAERERVGIEKLQESLILSGIAMSYVGNSRPASGGEHHLSHFWEMMFLFQNKPPVLHGIKVGVATLLILRLYEYLWKEKIDWDSIKSHITDFNMENYEQIMKNVFGKASKEIVQEEKKIQRYAKESREKRIMLYQQKWDIFIRETQWHIPSYHQAEEWLLALGHPVTPKDLGIEADLLYASLLYAKEIRSRFTILQLLDDLGLLEKYARQLVFEIYEVKPTWSGI